MFANSAIVVFGALWVKLIHEKDYERIHTDKTQFSCNRLTVNVTFRGPSGTLACAMYDVDETKPQTDLAEDLSFCTFNFVDFVSLGSCIMILFPHCSRARKNLTN